MYYRNQKPTHLDRFGIFYVMAGSLALVLIIVALVVFTMPEDNSNYASAADFANQQCQTHGGVDNYRDSDEYNYVTGVCADRTAFSGEW